MKRRASASAAAGFARVHSPLVEPMLDAFEREYRQPTRDSAVASRSRTLTVRWVEPGAVTQPDYWRRHVREAVRFHDGSHVAGRAAGDCIVEIGPHPTLLAFTRSVSGDDGPRLVPPTLRKGRHDWEQLLETLACWARTVPKSTGAASRRETGAASSNFPPTLFNANDAGSMRSRSRARRGRTVHHPSAGHAPPQRRHRHALSVAPDSADNSSIR